MDNGIKIKQVSPGTVELRSKGKWRLRVNVMCVDGTHCRRNKLVSCRTKTDAKRELERWKAELLSEGSRIDPSTTTLRTFLSRYMEYCRVEQELSVTTLRGYNDIVKTRLDPIIDKSVGEITPADVQGLCSWLKTEGGKGGKPLSGTTVQKAFSFLKTALKYAVIVGVIEKNPCDFVKGPSRSKPKTSFLDEDEVQRMRFLLRGHPNRCFAAAANIALATGMRRGEVCALRWADVDFGKSMIHVVHSLCNAGEFAKGGKKLVLKDTKTDSSERFVSIDEDTLAVLEKHKEEQYYRLAYYGTKQSPQTPVCCDVFGEWYRPDCFTKDFEVFRASHGFDIRLHDLRHTQASLLLASGEDMITVSKRLGHSKVSTTVDVYSHLVPGKDQEAASKIGAIFSKAAV